MSAVDRMAVRTRSGEYRSLPRRQALALIAAGRAEADKGSRLAAPPLPETREAARAPQAPAAGIRAPRVPTTPETPRTAPQRAQTPSQIVDAATHGTLPDVVDVEDHYPATEDAGLEFLEELPDDVDPGDVPTVYAVELPPEPKATARRAEWATYADSLGVEVTSAMTKNQIRDAAQDAAQSLDRLPQPARTGGRLETPEDEPATERVADDEDPGTR
jgi:hypothetical protein